MESTINPIIFDIAFKPACPIKVKIFGAKNKTIKIEIQTRRIEINTYITYKESSFV